jgi:ubiquinone/menaquinone biosynthesis C-methylase UbiE
LRVRHPVDVEAGKRDIWAEWLSHYRFGGDAAERERMLERTSVFRKRVLDGAALAEGETLLDVGCGEGLVGFGAFERGAGHVVFSDISDDLLDLCRETAESLGLADRCSFVKAAADDLAGVSDASVDVLTTRSVLIYVAAKARAFDEFMRALRPGGRVSLFEPINSFGLDEKREGFWGYPTDGVADLAARVTAVFEEIQPATDPMLDFDERDLLGFAESAGFFPVELEYNAQVMPSDIPPSWDAFVNTSGNPLIPTIGEAIDRALSPEERARFVEHLRPLVEQGRGTWRMAQAYLVAVKPS